MYAGSAVEGDEMIGSGVVSRTTFGIVCRVGEGAIWAVVIGCIDLILASTGNLGVVFGVCSIVAWSVMADGVGLSVVSVEPSDADCRANLRIGSGLEPSDAASGTVSVGKFGFDSNSATFGVTGLPFGSKCCTPAFSNVYNQLRMVHQLHPLVLLRYV